VDEGEVVVALRSRWVEIRRFAFSQALVRSTGQRLRASGSRVLVSRRGPRRPRVGVGVRSCIATSQRFASSQICRCKT
jgi:hypothetical protein